LWMWLSDPARRTPLWLGYGTEDRLGPGLSALAKTLPADRVRVAPGGHDWPPWRSLWAQWLREGPLQSSAPRAACGT
jgi:hypothetical protein